MAGGIHLYIGDLRPYGSRQEPEAFIHGVISIQTFVRPRPEPVLVVHIKTADKIIPDAVAVLRVIAEDFEGVAVEPVQSVLGAKPKETLIVLHTAKHGVIGKSLLYLVVPEIVGLTGRDRGEKKENGKYETIMDQSDRVGFQA